MDMLKNTALAYFAEPDSRQLAHTLLLVLSAVTAVLLGRGNWRLNRLQFLLSAILIQSVWIVAAMVIQAAIPTMVGPLPLPPIDPDGPDMSMFYTNGWVLMLADLSVCAATGFAWGMAAMARCRDSFGKNDKAFALTAVASAMLGTPLVFAVLLLRGTKKKPDKRSAGALGWNADQDPRPITGRNTLDDPIVIPASLIAEPRDYVSAEYRFISQVHEKMEEGFKVVGQSLVTQNGRFVDKIKVLSGKGVESDWTDEREYYFDVTSWLNRRPRY